MSFIGRILRPLIPPRKGKGEKADRPGDVAERMAGRYLQDRGLKIIERNYRVRGGEIDLICADGDTIVFVEVRLRSSQGHGGAAASVTRSKQARIILAAQHWLSQRQMHENPCRFDCVLLHGLDDDQLEWIPDAFGTD